MFIIKYRKIFVSISAILVGLSIISIAYFGIDFGIDFKGGALLEVSFKNERPTQIFVQESLDKMDADLGSILIQPIGEDSYSIKMKEITEIQKNEILATLGADATETSFTSIGPSVGKELVRKSIISFILVALGIIFFIAFSFRKVSLPVSSWKYGLIAVTALIHDVLIPVGGFVVFSKIFGIQADTLFVVAILTTLGLSVSDTIVVFDRIRENLRIGKFKTFEETVGNSLNQVYTRSIITSLTVFIVLIALIIFGPESTKYFAMMLTAGMFFGTYSSIFVASPLLVMVKNLQEKNKNVV